MPQPKRSYRISYEDLEKHFDQPLVEVARKFDVCTTFFKVHPLLATASNPSTARSPGDGWFAENLSAAWNKALAFPQGISPSLPAFIHQSWFVTFGVVWQLKSLQRKMKASGQMLLVPQPEKTHQVARSSPDLQWMLAARSQMGLFPPEQRPDDQQLFETRAGRVAEMIEISAGQRVAAATGQRGPVDAGHIVCWDNQADVLTEETPEDSVTNHGACSKVEWGADMEDEVEEELIVVLSAMIRKTRGFQNVTTSI